MATFFKRTASVALGLVLATVMLSTSLLAMTQSAQTTYSSSGILTNNSAPSISSANSTNTHTEVKPPSKEEAKQASTQKDTSAQTPSTPTTTPQTATQDPVETKYPYFFDCKLSTGQVPWIPTKGLENAGNSCYASSLMQCLFAITPLMINISTMQESKDPVVENFRQLVQEKIAQASTNRTSHSYKDLYQSIRNQFFPTEGYQQQDAFLFFVRLSNVLGDQANIFKGEYSSAVTCTPHNHRNETHVRETCLSLAIPAKETTETIIPLVRLFNNYFATNEALKEKDKNNELKDTHRCKPCGEVLVPALKDTYLRKLPVVLVINLKRFNADFTRKDTTPVSIPWQYGLDIQTTYPSEQAAPPTRYNLTGVVIHHGEEIRGGHYTALVKNPGNQIWYECDDAKIAQLADINQLQTLGYWQHANSNPTMLFYVRNDVITRYADANKQAHTQAATQTTALQQVQTNNATASAATPQVASKPVKTQSAANNAFADLFPSTPSVTSQTIQSPKKSTCERITNWFWSWFASKADIPQATSTAASTAKSDTKTSTDASNVQQPKVPTDLERLMAGERNLRGANFKNIELSNIILLERDFTGADFSGAKLTNVIFYDDNLTRAKFIGAKLNDISFSHISEKGEADLKKLGLSSVDPSTLKLLGLDLTDADFSGSTKLTNVSFHNVNLTRTKFIGTTFNTTEFTHIEKKNGNYPNFSNSTVADCVFSYSEFSNATFDNAQINRMSMHHCILTDTSFAGKAQINASAISSSCFTEINMQNITMNTVVFDNCTLGFINLTHASLNHFFLENPAVLPKELLLKLVDSKQKQQETLPSEDIHTRYLGIGINLNEATIQESFFMGNELTTAEKDLVTKTEAAILKSSTNFWERAIFSIWKTFSSPASPQAELYRAIHTTRSYLQEISLTGTRMSKVYFVNLVLGQNFDNIAIAHQCVFDTIFFGRKDKEDHFDTDYHRRVSEALEAKGSCINGHFASQFQSFWPQGYARNNDTTLRDYLALAGQLLLRKTLI